MGVGELWTASVIWNVGGVARPMANVLHYRQATVKVQSTDILDLAKALELEVIPAMADCISDAVECSLVKIRSISDPTIGGDVSFLAPIPGTASGETYALQNAPLISWSTGLIGRHYQGRTYMPPPVESAISGAGAIGSGLLSLLGTAATAMVTIPSSPGFHAAYDLIVYSKANPDSTPPWGGAATLVQSYRVADHLKTQRRRSL